MEKSPCPHCGAQMVKATKQNYRYTASGLDNVVLAGVTVWRCPECGEEAVEIPRIEGLHQAIARALVNKPARLAAKEVRFLRTYLGWSGQDFAKHMGVTAVAVSRWENGQAMGPLPDRMLRLMVAVLRPQIDYALETLLDSPDTADPLRVRMKQTKKDWEPAAAA